MIGSVSLTTIYSYAAADRLVTLITPGSKLISMTATELKREMSLTPFCSLP